MSEHMLRTESHKLTGRWRGSSRTKGKGSNHKIMYPASLDNIFTIRAELTRREKKNISFQISIYISVSPSPPPCLDWDVI